MSIKIFSFDLETSGIDPKKNGIHQIAGRVYVDYKLKKEFYHDVKLMPGDEYSKEALAVSNKTPEDIVSESHCDPKRLCAALIKNLGVYCDKFSKTDKYFVLGYNVNFDTDFMRQFFAKNGDNYYGSWFWSANLDVMTIAQQHLIHDRHKMPNFQLGTVANHLGIDAEEKDLHNALFDVSLHEAIYEKITGIKFEK